MAVFSVIVNLWSAMVSSLCTMLMVTHTYYRHAYVFYHTISTAWMSFLWWNLLSVVFPYWFLNFFLVCISSCKHIPLLIDTSHFSENSIFCRTLMWETFDRISYEKLDEVIKTINTLYDSKWHFVAQFTLVNLGISLHCELGYWQYHQCHLNNCKRFELQGPWI